MCWDFIKFEIFTRGDPCAGISKINIFTRGDPCVGISKTDIFIRGTLIFLYSIISKMLKKKGGLSVGNSSDV